MSAENTYFLRLLCAFVHGQTAPPPTDVDIQRLLTIAQDCNLSGIVGYMLQPHAALLGEYAIVTNRWFFQTVGIFANRRTACDRLTAQLTAANIPFALLKGAVLTEVYPEKELRTGGDVDMFIPPAYIPQLKALLAENGDTITHEDARQVCISRPPLFVEFHFSLLADAAADNGALCDYLADPVPHMTVWVEKNTVDPTFHFVYLLAHQQHHYENDSPGIRSYLDLAVWLKNGFLPDTDTLIRTLRQAGLYDYAARALTLTSRWFALPSPLPLVKISDEDEAFLKAYLLEAGQFAARQNPRARQVADSGEKAPRLTALWRSLFPPAAHMRSDATYATLAKRCLPLAYIKRLFTGIFRRPQYTASSAKAIVTASKDAAARTRVKTITGGSTHEENRHL